MKKVNIETLIRLLQNPNQLKKIIESIRNQTDLDESILGFIELYDQHDGNCLQLQLILAENKRSVLDSIATKCSIYLTSKIFRYAALLAVVISLGLITFNYFKQAPFVLSQTYVDPGLPNFMHPTSGVHIEKIMFFYKKGDYQRAHELIEIANNRIPNNDTLIYYSAVMKHFTNDNITANQLFKTIMETKSTFSIRSTYYYSLGEVRLKHYSNAIKGFQKIITLSDENLSSISKKHVKDLREYLRERE